VEIASALADMGTPVWLPELKLCARSVGDTGVGVWGVPIGLPALGAVEAAGVSMVGALTEDGAAAVAEFTKGLLATPVESKLGVIALVPLAAATPTSGAGLATLVETMPGAELFAVTPFTFGAAPDVATFGAGLVVSATARLGALLGGLKFGAGLLASATPRSGAALFPPKAGVELPVLAPVLAVSGTSDSDGLVTALSVAGRAGT